MKDIAYGIDRPCILDIKIGRKTHDPFASPEKIKRQKLKYPLSESIGFQISGMRFFDSNSKTFIYYDKKFVQTLTKDDVIKCNIY
jgi:1D-myo-inositol-tetrakisphosphate 5-kinase/inositol-polyphosphate multikinase